jgi:hypothetical protein
MRAGAMNRPAPVPPIGVWWIEMSKHLRMLSPLAVPYGESTS